MTVLTWAAVLNFASMPACSVPGMVPEFWPAVVHVESHYDPLALHDDDTNRSFYPATPEAAEMIARTLMAEGHSVGVGLSQLTARSEQKFFDKFGLTIRQALEACTNMHTGARHYVNGALSIYQSGNRKTGLTNGYVGKVTARLAGPVLAKTERSDPPHHPTRDLLHPDADERPGRDLIQLSSIKAAE